MLKYTVPLMIVSLCIKIRIRPIIKVIDTIRHRALRKTATQAVRRLIVFVGYGCEEILIKIEQTKVKNEV